MRPNNSDTGAGESGVYSATGSSQSARTGAVPIFGVDKSPQDKNRDTYDGTSTSYAKLPPEEFEEEPPSASGMGHHTESSADANADSQTNDPVSAASPKTDTIAEEVAHKLKSLAFHGAAFGLVFGLFFTVANAVAHPYNGDEAWVGYLSEILAGGVLGAAIAAGFGKLLNIELKRQVRRSTDPAVRERILRKGAIVGRGNQARLTARALVLFLIVALAWSGVVALCTWVLNSLMVANGFATLDLAGPVLWVHWVAGVFAGLLSLIRVLRFRRSGIFAGAVAVDRVFHFGRRG